MNTNNPASTEVLMRKHCMATRFERFAVQQAIMLGDLYHLHALSDDGVGAFVDFLKTGSIENKPERFLPVGSVEFLRTMFVAFGMDEPAPMDYPQSSCAADLLGRDVKRAELSLDHMGMFVKPVKTKSFEAGVMNAIPRHLMGSEVWVSAPVRFSAEWRAYIQSGKIIGFARYDEFEIDVPEHEIRPFVERVMACVSMDESINTATYAVDVGMVDDQLVLVELNDAWATGYYARAITQSQYLAWLHTRWLELCGLKFISKSKK